jgi:DtxR family Mn-dependent transcriptional regulator
VSQAHSLDDYLETVYFLAFPVGEYGPVVRKSPALAVRVAELLRVSRAAASEMLQRLEAEGLIERGKRREPLLTVKGRRAAERVARRHRLVECFLTDFMGYSPAESHEQAEHLGDAFSDEMIERLANRLGQPERCPHGWPIDTAVEQAENRELVPLSDLEAGARARIVRLAEHDGELLRWFYEQGLTPDTEIEIQSAQPSAGLLTVRAEGQERAIGEKAAAGLFVRTS